MVGLAVAALFLALNAFFVAAEFALVKLGASRWSKSPGAAPPRAVVEAVERLQNDTKRLAREVTQLKTKLAMGGGAGQDADEAIEVGGVRLIRRKVADLDKDALRGLADSLKAKVQSGIVVIASAGDGKVQVVVAVTSDLTSRVKAGAMVKALEIGRAHV